MEEEGWLTAAERAPMVFPPTIEYKRSDAMGGPVGYLLEKVRNELNDEPLAFSDDEINRRGLKVVTTIQQPLQVAAQEHVAAFRAGSLPEQDGAVPFERTRVSLTSVDPKDGAIVAMYGGADFLVDQRSTTTYDKIQAGSTFKPFTLIAALQQGVPLTTRFDGHSPQTFGDWKVPNFGGGQFGTIDLVEATAQSVNTVYAQLNLQIGPELTAKVAADAGIKTPVDTNRANVLGTDAVRPLDVAGAYATIASGGVRIDPYMVRSVSYDDGKVAYEHKDPTERPFAADVIADTTYAMTQVVEKAPARTGSSRWAGRSPARPARRTTTSRPGSSASPPTSSPRCR